MAHLWHMGGGDCWMDLSLETSVWTIAAQPQRQVEGWSAGAAQGDCPILGPVVGSDAGEWVLLCSSGSVVLVNGWPVVTGIWVLVDRDEVVVPGVGRFYFSTEMPARVEIQPEVEPLRVCPRCRQEIVPGADSVRCPGCGVWHHQEEELSCWTYAERCALCDQPTELGGELRWTPEEI